MSTISQGEEEVIARSFGYFDSLEDVIPSDYSMHEIALSTADELSVVSSSVIDVPSTSFSRQYPQTEISSFVSGVTSENCSARKSR